MDKYQVLLILIVWYIVSVVTTAVFQTGEYTLMQASGNVGGSDWLSIWGFVVLLFQGLFFGFAIPGCPVILSTILTLPFWALLIYFIYLNIPKAAGSGSPQA